ncbi:M20 family metallopeptidase [Novosphingobium sp. AP12]|uniref:M20 metallopeptidase family protein n=1 Tax=Novosphingobium sp. AP12 TaxID=1144305 RepID=UPI0002721ECD|nr:M20 family metallopeptidase [Novosphingobium sp. AP12]EJL30070.1 amidohydrolase [Novosphingobium sp. AP12]
MPASLVAEAAALSDRITALRRAVHAEPEIGLHTPKTRDKIRAALAHLPLEWAEGPSTTGLVATLRGGRPGRSVLLRGDMDALPMPEETGLDFASTVPGMMHACGHDAHVAMLAGAAEILAGQAESLAGEVRFMFQPGEEGYHGARFMLEDGLLGGEGFDRPLPDAAFALHVMPNAPHGLIGGRAGPLLAAADQLQITVTGRGGHASMPHDTLDPVPIACEIVGAIQTMVARRFSVFDPVVVTVSKIEAGTAHNVISDSAKLTGTMRTLSAANRARLKDELPLLAAGIAGAHGLSAETVILEGFPVTLCDPGAVDFGEKVARDMLGEGAFQRLADPIMGAEDFAYVLEKVPGAMFFLGFAHAGDDWRQCCGIHSTKMMLDETVMPRGAAFLAGLATTFLARGWS